MLKRILLGNLNLCRRLMMRNLVPKLQYSVWIFVFEKLKILTSYREKRAKIINPIGAIFDPVLLAVSRHVFANAQ